MDLELERKKIFKDFTKKTMMVIASMIIPFILINETLLAVLVSLSILLGTWYFADKSEKTYRKLFRELFFNNINSDEYFQNIKFELSSTSKEINGITKEMAYDSELFRVSEFSSRNALSYDYKGFNVLLSRIVSETSGKHSETYAKGIFAVVDLKKENAPFFVTNNSKGFDLFFQKIGNSLFPNAIEVEYETFNPEDISSSLSVYASSESDYNRYLNILEFSLVGTKLYVMFNRKEFNLKNKSPFIFPFDKKDENPEQQIHDLKMYLSNTLHKIIDEVG